MEEKRECDGHCERCNVNQRTYCAAQMAYYNQQEIAEIKDMLLKKDSGEIQTKVGIGNLVKDEDVLDKKNNVL